MTNNRILAPKVGVGLRHEHYEDALISASSIDFVEVHSENFFAAGGATLDYLAHVRTLYDVSLHSTALGLGSALPIPESFLNRLADLVSFVNPMLVSDHASYAWGSWMGKPVHIGDLLPLSFNENNLLVLGDNINRVQNLLERQILIENLSSYVTFKEDEMSEPEFLVNVAKKTGCGLLVDLNNILVSAHNTNSQDHLAYAKNWLGCIPKHLVKEIHIAGHSQAQPGELIIDDHSQPVSEQCWQLYQFAIERFGNVPTLVEWDNNLPSWQQLIAHAQKAKDIAYSVNTSVEAL